MKPKTLISLAALLVLLPVFLLTSQAQENLLFRVDVPFEFIAGGVHLPAGQYLAFHTTPAIIQLVKVDGRASAWVSVNASPVASEGISNQLVFNSYGETYYLAQVKHLVTVKCTSASNAAARKCWRHNTMRQT